MEYKFQYATYLFQRKITYHSQKEYRHEQMTVAYPALTQCQDSYISKIKYAHKSH